MGANDQVMQPADRVKPQSVLAPQRGEWDTEQALRGSDDVRNARPTRAERERAEHEKGRQEEETCQKEAPDGCRRVDGARDLYRLADGVDGSSHAIATVLSRPGEDEAAH